MGCLTLPFRMLGCLVVILFVVLGWIYRDELTDRARQLYDRARGRPAVVSEAPGRASAEQLRSAERKVSALAAGRADSVVLTADEAASLVRNGLDAEVRSQLDSIGVRLLEGRVGVSALIRTARLPKELIGPVALALKEREPIEAEGPLVVAAPGRGEWEIDRFRFRDFPIPRNAVPKLLGRAMGDTAAARAVPVRLPRAVSSLRVRPGGLTLYRARPQ